MAAASNREAEFRAVLLSQIHDLLAKLATRPDFAGIQETAAVGDELFEVYLAVKARPTRTGRSTKAGGRRSDHADLSLAELAILAVCSHTPQTAKTIARKLRRVCNSYFRGQLTGLCRPRHGRAVLQRTPDGYRLPDDEVRP